MPSVWIEKHGKNWRCVWRIRGTGIRQSENCGPNKLYAQEFSNKKRLELFAGKLGLKRTQPNKTFSEFSMEYLRYCRTHKAPNTADHFDEPAIKSFGQMFGKTLLSEISTAQVEGWKMSLLENLSPTTARMRLRALRAAFSYANRLGLVAGNPASKAHMPPEVRRGRVLLDHELKALLEHLPDLAKRAVIFALHTGLRRGELLALDWKMVKQHQDRTWEIVLEPRQTKTRQGRVIPLHLMAKAVLGWPRTSGQVFRGLTEDVLGPAIRRAWQKAGIGRIRFHDLRHTWATHYMERTGDLPGLKLLGGWRSLNALDQYQHLTRVRSEGILTLDFGLSAPTMPPK